MDQLFYDLSMLVVSIYYYISVGGGKVSSFFTKINYYS